MFRVATFNAENLTWESTDRNPGIRERKVELKGLLERLNADVLCLQEIHAQSREGHSSKKPKRELRALKELIKGTAYEKYHRACTSLRDHDGVPRAERNLVILSRSSIDDYKQYNNDQIDSLMYASVMENAGTAENDEEGEKKRTRNPKKIGWERPVLHATITTKGHRLHIVNLHLKSRLPTKVKGQVDEKKGWLWHSAAGWAEGYFMSSIKRVGQALETRVILDEIFEKEPNAKVLVCGDFNAEPGEVPVEAICGRVENTGNSDLRDRVLVPCSKSVPKSIRYTHFHHGEGNLLDHILVSKPLLSRFESAEIHNEALHDESLPFATDMKYPESDHAPFVAVFDLSATP